MSNPEIGYQPDIIEEFRTANVKGQPTSLNMHYFKAKGTGPSPVFVWLHSGGFRTGRISHKTHRMLARWLTAANISVVFPEYRLKSRPRDLTDVSRQGLEALEIYARPDFPGGFRGAAAMAALEDAIAFLAWLESKRDEYAFSGPIVLGGSSAGAITALNVVYLAPLLEMTKQEVGGVISCSGGYAYSLTPPLVTTPVFALHNPSDPRVPSQPIIDLASKNSTIELMLSDQNHHGSWSLSPNEARHKAFARMIGKVREFSGVNAA
ncbi:putative esterase [Yoonia maritima]|uniref:Putative esterase n=1 Tax=Yoonia maritima TaxID=1435347 RepID=A0A2T0W4D2_9RHOB|nr:hypothetical protein [Yoonia maritima]PRY80283.1 putative esterase [Yoonia maritima]